MILCCGEALIDMVPAPGGLFRPLAGGSVYNTAVALGRLGAATGFLWPISRDPFGATLLAPLAAAGVDTSLCPRPDRPTTLAFVTLRDGEARYDFYDEGSAGRGLTEADLPALPARVAALMVGGISLVPDPCGAAIEALVAREAGRRVVFLDPNLRPFFIRDAAAHRARILRLAARADIVKLSAEDLDWLWPGRPVAEAADALLAAGAALVLTTAGAGGATAHQAGGRRLSVAAEPVAVADTIGAGDTFDAGVLAALARDGALVPGGIARLAPGPLEAALRLGVQAAAVTVSRPGADPPWAGELA